MLGFMKKLLFPPSLHLVFSSEPNEEELLILLAPLFSLSHFQLTEAWLVVVVVQCPLLDLKSVVPPYPRTSYYCGSSKFCKFRALTFLLFLTTVSICMSDRVNVNKVSVRHQRQMAEKKITTRQNMVMEKTVCYSEMV